MARMSVDDGLGRDPRLDHLAMLCGWSRRETAGCLQLDIWPICYDRVTPNIPARDLEIAASRGATTPVKHEGGFVGALIECGLARKATRSDTEHLWIKKSGEERVLKWRDQQWRDRIYVCGAAERISYILKCEDSGAEGGKRSAESRANRGKAPSRHPQGPLKGPSEDPQGSGNPSASASASASSPPSVSPSASVPVQDQNSARPSGGGTPLELEVEGFVPPPAPQAPRPQAGKRTPRPSNPSESELASVRVVLEKLSAQNGVRYSGTAEHTRLIVGRLREGASEQDLRAVIGYCALELEWKGDPAMEKFLRPETLFGPKTIAKYLDPARTWFSKLPPEELTHRDDAESEPEWMRGGDA